MTVAIVIQRNEYRPGFIGPGRREILQRYVVEILVGHCRISRAIRVIALNRSFHLRKDRIARRYACQSVMNALRLFTRARLRRQ